MSPFALGWPLEGLGCRTSAVPKFGSQNHRPAKQGLRLHFSDRHEAGRTHGLVCFYGCRDLGRSLNPFASMSLMSSGRVTLDAVPEAEASFQILDLLENLRELL